MTDELFVCAECRRGHHDRCDRTVLHAMGERPCACPEHDDEDDD